MGQGNSKNRVSKSRRYFVKKPEIVFFTPFKSCTWSCILNYGDSWNYPRTVYFTPLWPYIFSFSDDSYNLSRTVYFTLWRPFLFIRYFFKKWNRIISASDRIYYTDDRIFSVQNRIFYQDRIFSRTVYFTSPTSNVRHQHQISVTNITFWHIMMLVTDFSNPGFVYR